MIKEKEMDQVLVFARTKEAERLSKQLTQEGFKSLAIHGDKGQSARQFALDSFKNSKISVLVATDVAARGIDIKNLPYVVNYDLPQDPENYVHRIGRTGRAGQGGKAISFYCEGDLINLRSIEVMLSTRFARETLAGFEL